MSAPALDRIASHLRAFLAGGLAHLGPDPNDMWMSSVDARDGRPACGARSPGVANRVYRSIGAPGGSNLYWDMPLVAAAHATSCLTGDPSFGRAADEYVRAFLARCVAGTGVFLWGNHYYWDAQRGTAVRFTGDEAPVRCNPASDDGHLHEARPLPPAWEAVWRVDPDAADRCIRAIARMHLFDPDGGGFNRHADGKRSHAFLESGGILVESLAWLSRKTGDRSLVEAALRIARWSFGHRGSRTGVVVNNPTGDRWDALVGTTEVGLWSGSLLRACGLVGEEELGQIAREAVAAYLRWGWDGRAGRYRGMIRAEDGAHVAEDAGYPYQPGAYADPWEPLFPRHDYPLALAETCVRLFETTRHGDFEEAIRRFATTLAESLPARDGRGAYAEHYGRAIHFLLRASEALRDSALEALAAAVADEAERVLHVGRMYRGHPGEDRCDAVDGLGMLFLSLTHLATGREPNGMGFGF